MNSHMFYIFTHVYRVAAVTVPPRPFPRPILASAISTTVAPVVSSSSQPSFSGLSRPFSSLPAVSSAPAPAPALSAAVTAAARLVLELQSQ